MDEDIYSLLSAIDSMRIELDEMRKERDHARCLYCAAQAARIQGISERYYAAILGWDCFKENDYDNNRNS